MNMTVSKAPGALARFFDGDVWHSFKSSPMAITAAVIAAICIFCAVFANWVAPHNPFDLAAVNLSDSRLPPAWVEGGSRTYLLGTDDQGRDILSAIMYGARISLFVGVASVLVSMVVGVGLGLLSGFAGGKVDALIMRVCDVMLSFPSLLVALLIWIYYSCAILFYGAEVTRAARENSGLNVQPKSKAVRVTRQIVEEVKKNGPVTGGIVTKKRGERG